MKLPWSRGLAGVPAGAHRPHRPAGPADPSAIAPPVPLEAVGHHCVHGDHRTSSPSDVVARTSVLRAGRSGPDRCCGDRQDTAVAVPAGESPGRSLLRGKSLASSPSSTMARWGMACIGSRALIVAPLRWPKRPESTESASLRMLTTTAASSFRVEDPARCIQSSIAALSPCNSLAH